MSGIDTVFFDIGGVLVELEYEVTHRAFLEDCVKLAGREFDGASLAIFFREYFARGELGVVHTDFICGRASEETFLKAARKALTADLGYRGDEAKILRTFNMVIGKAMGRNVAVLQSAAKNPKVKTGIISDTNAAHVKVIRQRVPEAFAALPAERIFVSNEVGCLKRDGARIFQLCLEKIGSKAESAVMIDDYPRNLALAEGIGMKTVRVTPETDLRAELRMLGVEC